MILQNTIIEKQKVLLVIVDNGQPLQPIVDELTELVRSANGEVKLLVTQKRQYMDRETLIGSGKLQEIADYVKELKIDVVIFEEQLTPTQHRNIQDVIECLVMDRTNLILDIFALHARTAEGKKQVELAQLNYLLPRLKSSVGALSRQGGGIGTRGPGETKLETDRRHIKDRATKIKEELCALSTQRNVLRENRARTAMPLIAIVGYTNAGKSTLFNALTKATVLTEDKLFATLDTTVRKLELKNGMPSLLIDTVGFIRNLPHTLIEAFKSTLEETTNADIIFNVCDASSDEMLTHLEVTKEILHEIGANAPIINVFNKIDLVPDFIIPHDSVAISALNGYGFDLLNDKIMKLLMDNYIGLTLKIPFADMSIMKTIETIGVNSKVKYLEDCVLITTTIRKSNSNKVAKYILSQ